MQQVSVVQATQLQELPACYQAQFGSFHEGMRNLVSYYSCYMFAVGRVRTVCV